MTSTIHAGLAAGRWHELSLLEQLASIGSEVGRASRAKAARNEERLTNALDRCLELLDLTLADDRWRHRRREIARAREIVCDFLVSSGASSDLQSATALVTRMVTQLGLAGSGKLMWSDSMSAGDTAHAEALLAQAYDRSLKKLKQHRSQLEGLATALADRQELTGEDARRILVQATNEGRGT